MKNSIKIKECIKFINIRINNSNTKRKFVIKEKNY